MTPMKMAQMIMRQANTSYSSCISLFPRKKKLLTHHFYCKLYIRDINNSSFSKKDSGSKIVID